MTRKAPARAESLEDLFDFRRFGVRQEKATLFQPFSTKLRRRLELHTPARYRLWVRVETDLTIAFFNECVRPCSVPVGKGVAASLRPAMVTRDVESNVTVHTFSGALDADEESSEEAVLARAMGMPQSGSNVPADTLLDIEHVAERAALVSAGWAQWCEARELLHHDWTVAELREPKLRLDNLDRLLRYTTRPGRPYRGDLASKLEAELRLERCMTVYALAKLFPSQDPEEVMAEIAGLIVSGKVHSNIETHPFTYATELSAFSTFEAKSRI